MASQTCDSNAEVFFPATTLKRTTTETIAITQAKMIKENIKEYLDELHYRRPDLFHQNDGLISF